MLILTPDMLIIFLYYKVSSTILIMLTCCSNPFVSMHFQPEMDEAHTVPTQDLQCFQREINPGSAEQGLADLAPV